MTVTDLLPTSVAADHRSIAAYYPGGRIAALMDFAHLQAVTLILLDDQLFWQLDGTDHAVMLVPFGIDGDATLRRELQALPGFDDDLLFRYLDDRAEEAPPLTLWAH